MQAGIEACNPMLESVLPHVVGWVLDAWLVLHDDLRRLPMLQLPAGHLGRLAQSKPPL